MLVGFAYGGVTERTHSAHAQQVLFSIFVSLSVSLSYHLSRASSDPTVILSIMKRHFLAIIRQGRARRAWPDKFFLTKNLIFPDKKPNISRKKESLIFQFTLRYTISMRPVAAYSEDTGGGGGGTARSPEREEVETADTAEDNSAPVDPLPKKLR